MKKTFLLSALCSCLYMSAHSQDFGYRTFDIGGEYQWQPGGNTLNLQIAFNSKIHHSLIIRGGYNKTLEKNPSPHSSEEATGYGGSLGYRYYFGVIPKRAFLGIRADVWNMTVNWTAVSTKGRAKLIILQPGAELGYTILVNEVLFITPYIAASKQLTVNAPGETLHYGSDFIPTAGISVGWRF